MSTNFPDNPLLGPLSRADFIAANMPLVYSITERYYSGLRDDLTGEGMLALVVAYDRYSDASIDFTRWAAAYIHGYISNYFRKSSGPGRIPNSVYPLACRIIRDGRAGDTAEEIAAAYGVPLKAARKALAGVSSRNPIALEDDVGKGATDDTTALYVDEFIAQLKPSQQRIVSALMGGQKMADIAREMSVSKQAVHNSVALIRKRWAAYEALSA